MKTWKISKGIGTSLWLIFLCLCQWWHIDHVVYINRKEKCDDQKTKRRENGKNGTDTLLASSSTNNENNKEQWENHPPKQPKYIKALIKEECCIFWKLPLGGKERYCEEGKIVMTLGNYEAFYRVHVASRNNFNS